MSVQQTELSAEEEEVEVEVEGEFEKYFTVFDGSSPENVSYAKQLWSSVWLLPPQESRLESADIRQRLPVARAHGDPADASKTPGAERLDPVASAREEERQRYLTMATQREERQRYLAMAARREDILALLRRQRGRRVEKERESRAHNKPSARGQQGARREEPSRDLEMDRASVQQLQ